MAQISEEDPDETATFIQAAKEKRLLVAELTDESRSSQDAVGFLLLGHKDGGPHILELNVVPAAAGLRIGSRLIDAVRQRLENEGKGARMTLTTFRDVPWNAPYYRRLGFEILAQGDLGPELSRCLAEETSRLPPALFGPRVAMQRNTAKALF